MSILPKTNAGQLTAGHVIKRTAGGTVTRAQTAEERRRAQRVMLRVTVLVHVTGRVEPIRATTVTVSENGGMLVMADGLPMGAKVKLENPRSQKTVDAHVVRAAQNSADGMQVPVEFSAPSPNFWGVFFPPSAN